MRVYFGLLFVIHFLVSILNVIIIYDLKSLCCPTNSYKIVSILKFWANALMK